MTRTAAGSWWPSPQLGQAGWGPQQLAAELVDDLRQGVPAALAPDLASVSGSELDRLSSLATRLGLPRLVRTIETLGRAQVDMREAPDARVVLEMALVRMARPELDDSPSALSDRLARVERAIAGGGGSRSGHGQFGDSPSPSGRPGRR